MLMITTRRRRSAESDYQGQEKSVAMDSDIDTWGLLVLMYLLVDRARRQQLGNSIGRLVIESRAYTAPAHLVVLLIPCRYRQYRAASLRFEYVSQYALGRIWYFAACEGQYRVVKTVSCTSLPDSTRCFHFTGRQSYLPSVASKT